MNLRCLIVICGCAVPLLSGCLLGRREPMLPESHTVIRDQLMIHSDFRLSRKHQLLDELAEQRNELARTLGLPTSDEPINVYLFDNPRRYRAYMDRHFPDFPDRRAYFMEEDASLNVYAHWGDRVAEDLRHEVAHGYLHSVVPNVPLWLDEGLAEYFEVVRGLNAPHVQLLVEKHELGEWTPDIQRLEQLRYAAEMTQLDYAESWLWVHMLVETTPTRLAVIRNHLNELRTNGAAPPLSKTIAASEPAPARALIQHLNSLTTNEPVPLRAE